MHYTSFHQIQELGQFYTEMNLLIKQTVTKSFLPPDEHRQV